MALKVSTPNKNYTDTKWNMLAVIDTKTNKPVGQITTIQGKYSQYRPKNGKPVFFKTHSQRKLNKLLNDPKIRETGNVKLRPMGKRMKAYEELKEMNILTFKMWEDAAANSAGGGGIDGIGVGDKGEPGVHMKKKKKKEKEVLKKFELERRLSGPGSNRSADWERRGRLSRKVRADFWKNFKGKQSPE